MNHNRATGRDIIEMVLQNMEENLEPLHYKTLAPSLYRVYLNEEDYRRLEAILPDVTAETKAALQEALDRLNRQGQPPWPAGKGGWLRKLFKVSDGNVYQPSANNWDVRFSPDLDGELKPGDIAVSSQLTAARSDDVAGKRTRRVTTRKSGAEVKSHSSYETEPPRPAQTAYAKLSYEDQQGPHVFEMRLPRIKIGRGGVDHWVDLKLETLPDVSREHAHIRFDEASGRFYISDKSTYGTSVNGRALPKGTEEPLPEKARIGLADVIFLDFGAQER